MQHSRVVATGGRIAPSILQVLTIHCPKLEQVKNISLFTIHVQKQNMKVIKLLHTDKAHICLQGFGKFAATNLAIAAESAGAPFSEALYLLARFWGPVTEVR